MNNSSGMTARWAGSWLMLSPHSRLVMVQRAQARQSKTAMAEQTVHNWKNAFLDAGRAGLAGAGRRRSCREAELEAECKEPEAGLGEAHVQLRVWKKGAECLPALGTSR